VSLGQIDLAILTTTCTLLLFAPHEFTTGMPGSCRVLESALSGVRNVPEINPNHDTNGRYEGGCIVGLVETMKKQNESLDVEHEKWNMRNRTKNT
jgi:hypothetical protein